MANGFQSQTNDAGSVLIRAAVPGSDGKGKTLPVQGTDNGDGTAGLTVETTPSGTQNVAIVAPLGTQNTAASVAVVDSPLINKQFALNAAPFVINDTSNHTGLTASGFLVLSACVFTTCTGITGTSGITFPSGVTVIAPITSITLASGTILVYPA